MPATFVPNGNQNPKENKPLNTVTTPTVADIQPIWTDERLPTRFNPKDKYDPEFTVDL